MRSAILCHCDLNVVESLRSIPERKQSQGLRLIEILLDSEVYSRLPT